MSKASYAENNAKEINSSAQNNEAIKEKYLTLADIDTIYEMQPKYITIADIILTICDIGLCSKKYCYEGNFK